MGTFDDEVKRRTMLAIMSPAGMLRIGFISVIVYLALEMLLDLTGLG